RGIVFPGKSFFSAHEVSTCKISGCLSYRILDSGPDGTQTTLTSVPTTDIAKSSLECFSRLSHWERTSMIRETHSSLDKLHESKMRCSLFHGS
ncbi:hypothetical protein FV303_23985, partial [Escherichia coli]